MTDIVLSGDLNKMADIVENGWCQEWWAKNSRGRNCSVEDRDATSFCISGGMYRLIFVEKRAKNDTAAMMNAITDQFRLDYPDESKRYTSRGVYTYVSWQDEPGRKKEEVVALIRRAAERVGS